MRLIKHTIEHPKVFISYAWSSEDYQNKVLAFATDLMRDGIDVIFDKWSLKEGNDTYSFMEKSVTDDTITNVLILLDPIYAKKANDRAGGVGTETQIISSEIYNKVTQDKFLPIVFERDSDGSIQKPTYLKSILHFDLSYEEKYFDEYQRLVKKLYGIEIYSKPELGVKPEWLNNETTISTKSRKKYEKIKKSQENDKVKNNEFILLIEENAKNILEYNQNFGVDGDFSTDDYIEYFDKAKYLRDEYLQMYLLIPYIKGGTRLILDNLQNLSITIATDYRNSLVSDSKTIIIHELFIYLVAYLIKTKNDEDLSYLINRTYFGKTSSSNYDATNFNIFYSNSSRLDAAMKDKYQKRYFSGTCEYWMNNINIDICSKNEFVFADIMLYNAAILSPNYKNTWFWFPLSYVYEKYYPTNEFRKFAINLKSKESLGKAINIFGFNNIEEFIKKYKELEKKYQEGNFKDYRYSNSFDSASVLFKYIKSDELGMFN